MLASAKAGIGIEDILEQIVEKVPAPTGNPDAPLKALIFDSHYDQYRGVIAYIRIIDGSIKPGETIRMMATGKEFEVLETGVFTPRETAVKELNVGDVGFLSASIKRVGDTQVGDTITKVENPATEALEGYRQMNPMVFCGLYPIDQQVAQFGRRLPDRRLPAERGHHPGEHDHGRPARTSHQVSARARPRPPAPGPHGGPGVRRHAALRRSGQARLIQRPGAGPFSRILDGSA